MGNDYETLDIKQAEIDRLQRELDSVKADLAISGGEELLNDLKIAESKEITTDDQLTLLRIKSLLSYFQYFIKDGDWKVVDEFHSVCRKYCLMGGK